MEFPSHHGCGFVFMWLEIVFCEQAAHIHTEKYLKGNTPLMNSLESLITLWHFAVHSSVSINELNFDIEMLSWSAYDLRSRSSIDVATRPYSELKNDDLNIFYSVQIAELVLVQWGLDNLRESNTSLTSLVGCLMFTSTGWGKNKLCHGMHYPEWR